MDLKKLEIKPDYANKVIHSLVERELTSTSEFDAFSHAEMKIILWSSQYNVRKQGNIKFQKYARKLANY